MKQIASYVFLGIWLLLASPGMPAEQPLVVPVWPGKVPGDYGTIGRGASPCSFGSSHERCEMDHQRHETDDHRLPSGEG